MAQANLGKDLADDHRRQQEERAGRSEVCEDVGLFFKADPCAEKQHKHRRNGHGNCLCQPQQNCNKQNQEAVPAGLIQSTGNEVAQNEEAAEDQDEA